MASHSFVLSIFFVLLVTTAPTFCTASTLVADSKSWHPSGLPSPQRDPQRICGYSEKSAVCSPDGLLSRRETNKLNGLISSISTGTSGFRKSQCGSNRSGYQDAIAIVNKMDIRFSSREANKDVKFAQALHAAWGIEDPECDNGVIIFISVADGEMQILTGPGATALTDARIQSILKLMGPLLRKAEYGKAVLEAVYKIGNIASTEGLSPASQLWQIMSMIALALLRKAIAHAVLLAAERREMVGFIAWAVLPLLCSRRR